MNAYRFRIDGIFVAENEEEAAILFADYLREFRSKDFMSDAEDVSNTEEGREALDDWFLENGTPEQVAEIEGRYQSLV